MTAIDDVKARLDILDVVSQHVALSRSGRNYKANCPFHQERTPSFYVFPDRQSWRCFGACATGGDAISFVMRSENLEFGEALQRLAQQTGVVLPSRQKREGQQAATDANQAALEFFQQTLRSAQGEPVREYLDRRGVSRESIEKFELGLNPASGGGLKAHLTGRGFTDQQGVEAGVLRTSDSGWTGDLFRGRLIIPIRDSAGALAGFGGRSLDDSQPKYLNSPRSPIFDKSRILYGMHLAKDAAREKGLVIVEGYLDAIMAHQHGFDNVVASMGTALTQEQVAQVKRLTNRVVMALDPDAAGQQAILRSLESSWRVFQSTVAGRSGSTTLFQRPAMTEIAIATLPEGEDPDTLIRRSPEEWDGLTRAGRPLMEYLLDALATQVDTTTAQGKTRLVELVFPLIAAVPDPVQQDQYFQLLASRLDVTQETLRASVGSLTPARRASPRTSRPASATASPFAKLDHDPVEDYCLALLLKHPELADIAENLREELFRRHENRQIVAKLTNFQQDEWGDADRQTELNAEPERLERLRMTLEEEVAGQLEFLIQKPLPALDGPTRTRAFNESVSRLEERHLKEMKVEEGLRFSEAPPELLEESHQNVLDVNQRIKENQSGKRAVDPRVAGTRS